jgi:hypothetical protein
MCEPSARRASVGPRTLGALVAFLLVLTLLPAAANAATAPWSVSVLGEYGDPIADGNGNAFYDDGNAWMQASASESAIAVDVASTWRYADYTLYIAAPAGESLKVGTYPRAVGWSKAEPADAKLDVSGNGHGCGSTAGSYEIKDFALSSSGAIERLWLTFEQHCDGERPAIFGEVRIGKPVTTIPSSVRWPDREISRRSSVVPVTFLASAPTTITGAAVTGQEFAIVGDHCSGVALAAGDACEVWVQPDAPAAATDSAAALRLTEAGGSVHSVSLARHVDATLTEVAIKHDDGSWYADGGARRWTPDASGITAEAHGSRVYVRFHPLGSVYGSWAVFGLPNGKPLAPGTYTGAVLPADADATGGPAIDVPTSDPCGAASGEFTIHEVSLDAHGALTALDVSFEQRCSKLRGRFIGAIRFRASDTASWQPPPQGDPPPEPTPTGTPVPPPVLPPGPQPVWQPPLVATSPAIPPHLALLSTSLTGSRVRLRLLASRPGTVRGTLTRCVKTTRRGCSRSVTVTRIAAPVRAGIVSLALPLRARARPGRYTLTLRLTASDGRVSAPLRVSRTVR